MAEPQAAGAGTRDAVWLLGVPIDRLRLSGLLARVSDAVRWRRRITVLYVNAHCMNVARKDAGYHALLGKADIVYCDGTGVRLAAAFAGEALPARMTGADWIDDLCRLAVRESYSLFLLGSAEGLAERAAQRLQSRYPDLRIAGALSGFDLGAHTVVAINESRCDILLVGMGTPRQEKWIAAHRSQLDVPVVWAVGALFDFVSGHLPRGPRWMTDHGMEWLCRLAVEPRKLWRRYLLGIPLFLWAAWRNRARRP